MTIHHETLIAHTHADGTSHTHDGVPYKEHGDCGHTGPGHTYYQVEDDEGGLLAIPCEICKAAGPCLINGHVRHAAPAHLDGHQHEWSPGVHSGPVTVSEHGHNAVGQQKWIHRDHPANDECEQESCTCPYVGSQTPTDAYPPPQVPE